MQDTWFVLTAKRTRIAPLSLHVKLIIIQRLVSLSVCICVYENNVFLHIEI